MKEKELQQFNKITDGMANALPRQQSLDQWIGLALMHFMKFNKHFADATRQLTRIADQDNDRMISKGIYSTEKPTKPTPDPEKFIDNLANLLSLEHEADETDPEYLNKAMAIVNEWRRKQGAFPHPIDNALVNLLKDIEAYLQGERDGTAFEGSDLMARIKKVLDTHEKSESRPVNDALVEAVKKVLDGDFSFDRDHRLTAIHDILDSALANHEKAVKNER